MCDAEYSLKRFSLCFAGFMSALNFNDTSIKIGADVSRLTESQVEGNEQSRGNKLEYTLATVWSYAQEYFLFAQV